jgi:hypothetical protein
MKMKIREASPRVISNEPKASTNPQTSKVESEARKNLMKDTFENPKTSDSDQGKKTLTFDQERLAGTANYNNVTGQASEMINGEAQFKNQPTDKNPYGPGVKGSRKDSLQELRNKVKEQKEQLRAGSQEPTGPNVGAEIDQLVSGKFTVETAGTKKAEEDRKHIIDGATGNMLLESANDTVKDSTPFGKDMLKDEYFGSLPSTTTKNKDGTTTKTQDGAFSHSGKIFQFESKTTYDKNGKETNHTTKLTEYNSSGKVVTETEKTKDKTTEKQTTTKNSGETTTKTTTTTTSPDSTKTTTTTEKTTKGGGVKDPGENPGITPEELRLPGGYKLASPGAVVHRNGSGDGGDVDPDPNATTKGKKVDDEQIHLQELGKYGMIGQPDKTTNVGGGSGSAGTGQLGGDIDMGPDSISPGYAGATRMQDPGDVNFNVGAEPLIGMDSKEEEEEDKNAKEEKSIKNYMFRRIQA